HPGSTGGARRLAVPAISGRRSGGAGETQPGRLVAAMASRRGEHRDGRVPPMTTSIEAFAWPAARLGEALEALVRRSGLVSPQAAAVRLAGPRDDSDAE